VSEKEKDINDNPVASIVFNRLARLEPSAGYFILVK